MSKRNSLTGRRLPTSAFAMLALCLAGCFMTDCQNVPNQAGGAVRPLAPGFSGFDLNGAAVSLDTLRGDKATLLVFSSITCPTCEKTLPSVPKIKKDFVDRGVSVAVIEAGSTAEKSRPLYAKWTPGVTVIADPDKAISSGLYDVEEVPFFCLLDKDGKIAHFLTYDEQTAREAIDVVLGLSKKPVEARSKGAG